MPFRDIAGHRHLLQLVSSAVERAALPHSLIFAGPEGVGKRSAAIALAQLVNCRTPVRGDGSGPDTLKLDACGTCASCDRIARGVHADVIVVQPGDNGTIKVDQIRDAVEKTAYRPFEGQRRVVIIDGADSILPEAQNALLKTLEEPPAASMFVLVTSRPDVLLPTVRSRCQRLRFGRILPADIAAILVSKFDYAEAEAHAAASAADGSVAAALEGASEDVEAAREAAARLLEGAAASRDPGRRLQGAKVLSGGGVDRHELARRLQALSSLLRDVGLLLSGADERSLANVDMKARLAAVLRSFDGERAVAAFAAVDRALWALERNASPKIVADWVAFQL
jgi:DNA polymerase-3 subunit delta'